MTRKPVATPRALKRTPPAESAAELPLRGQPVFNLTRAIELLNASVESDIAFATPEQPYCAGDGIRTTFLSGHGAPFTLLREGVSDSYTDLVRLEEGFYLRVIKDSRRGTTHVVAPGEDWLKIVFALDGSITQVFGPDRSFQYTGARAEIHLHPPGVVKVEGVEDGSWGTVLSLYFSRDALLPYVESEIGKLPASIARFLRETPEELILETMPMSSSIMRAVVDVVTTRYIGKLRHFYVRAKAIELLCEVVHHLTHEHELTSSDLRLSWRDKRSLEKARLMIRQEFVRPPSIRTLARHLGMNARKLRTGFKHLFGAPIFQYTQNLRLEKALQLLHTGDYSIREVADAMGYNHAKNFASAFKKHYGVSPKMARKSYDRTPRRRSPDGS